MLIIEVWSYFEDPLHSETSLVVNAIAVAVAESSTTVVNIAVRGLPLSIYVVSSIASKVATTIGRRS